MNGGKTFCLADWVDVAPAMGPVDDVQEILAAQTLGKVTVVSAMSPCKNPEVTTVIVHSSAKCRLGFSHLRQKGIPL